MKRVSAKPQYLFDESGEKAFVILTARKYEELLENLHDLAVIAERRDEPTMTLEEFQRDLEADGRL